LKPRAQVCAASCNEETTRMATGGPTNADEIVADQRAGYGVRGVALCPNVGSLDLLDLFRDPAAWAESRRSLSAFKLYWQHALDPWPEDPATVEAGPNTYRALVAVGAFRTLAKWGLPLHLEVPAVKETDAPERRGEQWREPARACVDDVRAAGGEVAVLCMDEPLASMVNGEGEHNPLKLGVDQVGAVAGFTAGFAHAVADLGPAAVALLEAYPDHPAARLEMFLRLLTGDNAVPLSFFELDIDLDAIRNQRLSNDDVRRDLEGLKGVCHELSIPLRAIVTGTHARSAAEFRDESMRLASLLVSLARPLDGVTVQSWVKLDGLKTIPPNLPLGDSTSLLALLNDVLALRLLEAAPGSPPPPRHRGLLAWLLGQFGFG
jgi:hypothetical protein